MNTTTTKRVAWYDPRVARGMAAQLTRWHERLKAGEKPLGWKAGLGTTEAMERLDLSSPLIGHLTDRSRLAPGSTVSLAGWSRPAAEPEIAVYLGKDLPGGASRDAARLAVSGIAPAIELADVDFPPDDVEAILKSNVYQRHVILGPCDRARAGCRLDGLSAVVIRNGTETTRTVEIEESTGDVLDIVRHVADLLAAYGERLRAGQVVIGGSITPPLWAEADEEIVFQLEPVGSVSVRFSPAS